MTERDKRLSDAFAEIGRLAQAKADAEARCAELERDIYEAREACPVSRRQDYLDASLLTLVNEEIRQIHSPKYAKNQPVFVKHRYTT